MNRNRPSKCSELALLLAERIRETGRITFRDWMEEALYHPTLGYYNRPDLKRWGREGDYRTSPERSELFAATFARYFVRLYERLGHPTEFNIVEMGAGNGEFAAGALNSFKSFSPDLLNATHYVVIETSEVSCQLAAERLDEFRSHVQFCRLADLQHMETAIFFSNELLDAFPVHRMTVKDGKLMELFVTLNNEGNFTWTVDDPSSEGIADLYRSSVSSLTDGQIVELNLEVSNWFRTIQRKLTTGYLITVDYGAEAAELYSVDHPKGTLRGFHRHEFVDDVLCSPGEYDITSNVDWTYVKSEGKKRGFEIDQFARLDQFLMQAGILEELENRLADATSEAERAALTTSAREMILPGGMASRFQVLVQKR